MSSVVATRYVSRAYGKGEAAFPALETVALIWTRAGSQINHCNWRPCSRPEP